MAMMKADLLQDVMPSTGNKSTIVSSPRTTKTTGSTAANGAGVTPSKTSTGKTALDLPLTGISTHTIVPTPNVSVPVAGQPVAVDTSVPSSVKTADQIIAINNAFNKPVSTPNVLSSQGRGVSKYYNGGSQPGTQTPPPPPSDVEPEQGEPEQGGPDVPPQNTPTTGSPGSSVSYGSQSGMVSITQPTPIAGQPNVEPLPTIEQAVPIDGSSEGSFQHTVSGSGDALYGQHSHDEYQNEIPNLQKEIEQILQAEYDKYGALTQQQIEYATQQAVNDLQRQLEDAAPTYNAERAKLAANQLNARDNLALQNTTRGVNGGIAQKQYSDQEAAYDSQMLNIDLQQIQLATDVGRQITDLEAQGDFESAKALLEVGIAKLKELQDAKQNYQNLRIQQAQILDNYDMESEQTTYNRAWARLQAGLFNAADAQALGVDPSQAQQFSNYVNTMRQLDAEQARLALEQQVLKNEATQLDIDNARTAAAMAAAGANGSSGASGSSGADTSAAPYSGSMTNYEWNVYQSGLQGEGLPVYDSTGNQVALFSIGANGKPTVDLSKHPDWYINLAGRPLYWDDQAGDFVGAEAQQANVERVSTNSAEREWFARYLQELDESGGMGVSPAASTPTEAVLDLRERIDALRSSLNYWASVRYGTGSYYEREEAAKNWRNINAQMGRFQALLDAYPKSERVVLS